MTLAGERPQATPRQDSSEFATTGGSPRKPGFRTTEFWITVLLIVVGTVLVLGGKEELGTTLILGAAAPYVVSRGMAKR